MAEYFKGMDHYTINVNMRPIIAVLITLLVCGPTAAQTASEELDSVISTYQDHQGYDREAYPMGYYNEDYCPT